MATIVTKSKEIAGIRAEILRIKKEGGDSSEIDSLSSKIKVLKDDIYIQKDGASFFDDVTKDIGNMVREFTLATIRAQELKGSIVSNPKPKPDKVEDPEVVSDNSFLDRLKAETEQLQYELELRQQIKSGAITEEDAQEQLALQKIFTDAESKRAAILENEQLTADQVAELNGQIAQQILINLQSFEDEKTSIKKESTDSQIAMDQLILQSQLSTYGGILNALGAFSNKSKTLSKVIRVTQGALSAYQIYASSEAAAAMALAQPPGPPYTIPFAASISLSGKARAAGVLAGAVAGAFSGGGGGGGGGGVSVPSIPTTSPQTAQQQNPVNNRYVEIRGIDDDQILSGGQVKDIIAELTSSDDDVIISISQGQVNGTREGVI